jgi:hypothetical protein
MGPDLAEMPKYVSFLIKLTRETFAAGSSGIPVLLHGMDAGFVC